MMGSYAIIRTRVQNSAVIYILTTFSPHHRHPTGSKLKPHQTHLFLDTYCKCLQETIFRAVLRQLTTTHYEEQLLTKINCLPKAGGGLLVKLCPKASNFISSSSSLHWNTNIKVRQQPKAPTDNAQKAFNFNSDIQQTTTGTPLVNSCWWMFASYWIVGYFILQWCSLQPYLVWPNTRKTSLLFGNWSLEQPIQDARSEHEIIVIISGLRWLKIRPSHM